MLEIIQDPARLESMTINMLGLQRREFGFLQEVNFEPGRIAITVKNGKRQCHCLQEYGPNWANHCWVTGFEHIETDIKPRMVNVAGSDFHASRPHPKGGLEKRDRAVCDKPDGMSCTCPGCIITYRLKAHPLFIEYRPVMFDAALTTLVFAPPSSYRHLFDMLGSYDHDKWIDFHAALASSDMNHLAVKELQDAVALGLV